MVDISWSATELWRTANPSLAEAARVRLVARLMAACRAVRTAKRANDREADAAAHRTVDDVALGERAPPWWDDGFPDLNRRLARNTSNIDWYARLTGAIAGGR
jgi:hypothetical protein